MNETTVDHFRLQLINEALRIAQKEPEGFGVPVLRSVTELLMEAMDNLKLQAAQEAAATNRRTSQMDYSVGSPLWQEWQRLQTHSEWDRWKVAYEQKQPLIFFQIYFDWLLENGFPVEAEFIKKDVIQDRDWDSFPTCRYYTPPFEEKGKLVWLKERPNSEPVEGTA